LKKSIKISPEISRLWPSSRLGCIACHVKVEPAGVLLTQKMDQVLQTLNATYEMEEISQLPPIFNGRKAYRRFGKDPARYRLSAEALLRRVTRGDDLYRINNVIDVVNQISLMSGFSIGAYDTDKIEGNIEFSIGKIDELYDSVGRGWLNIENLPVLRDDLGSFGSSTTDSVRTSVTFSTQNFMMVFFDYGCSPKLEQCMQRSLKMLCEWIECENILQLIVHKNEADYA
jgi:DNA/RNA-binding domain of Phe-tRNA-synthetase-like protein